MSEKNQEIFRALTVKLSEWRNLAKSLIDDSEAMDRVDYSLSAFVGSLYLDLLRVYE